MFQTTQEKVRKRDPSEFIGLERALWDDRKAGVVHKGYVLQLRKVATDVELAMGQQNLDPVQAERLAALALSVKTARQVLKTAREAIQAMDATASAAPVFSRY